MRFRGPQDSHDSVTCSRSPEVISTAFHAQPPDLPPGPLMEVDVAITCSLAWHRRPHQIQFLSIGSRVCSTLLSDLASRLGPCASLSLRLHQAVKRTFTSKLSNMLGTQQEGLRPGRSPIPIRADSCLARALLLFFGRFVCRWSRRLCRGRRLRRTGHAVFEAADAFAKSLHDF